MELLEKIQKQIPGANQTQVTSSLIKMGKTEQEVLGNNGYLIELVNSLKNTGGLATQKSDLVSVQNQIAKLESKPKSKSNQLALSNLRIQLQELQVQELSQEDNKSKTLETIDKGLNTFLTDLNRSSKDANSQLEQTIVDYASSASEVAYTALEAHNAKVKSINDFAKRANENLNSINKEVIDRINSDIDFQATESPEEMIARLGISLDWTELVKS